MPPVLILAHEFFDALPVMIFEKTEHGWVEKLVDNNVDLGTQYFTFTQAPIPAYQFRSEQPQRKEDTESIPYFG